MYMPKGNSIKNEEVIKMGTSYKELRLFTLRGDIWQCLNEGLSKYGTAQYLEKRFVYPGSEITDDEFSSILNEEYRKLLAQKEKAKEAK